MKRIGAFALATAAALGVASCGGGGDGVPQGVGTGGTGIGTGTGTGTLSVSLTDNPCGYRAVNVTVTGLKVNRSASAADGDAGWIDVPLTLPPAQRRVDLLTLQNGTLLKLGDVSLEAGGYQQIRLLLAENSGSGTPANAVTLADGTVVALTTPSAQQSGLKLVSPFEVKAGQIVELALDFDACKSVVSAGNSGKYLLKPTIAVIPLLDVGAIAGFAPKGAWVSAQTLDAEGRPVVVKATTATAADGAFSLSPLPAGSAGTRYTVVVAGSGAATAVVKSVPVTSQQTTALSTALAPIAPPASVASTVSGTVGTAGLDAAEVRALQTVDGTPVEVATTVVGPTPAAFSLALPRAAARVATHPATAPATLPLAFTDATGTPGAYSIEASGGGRRTVPVPFDAAAGNATLPAPMVP